MAPKKRSGEIGPTRITGGPLSITAEYQHIELPEDKEQLERFFAAPFVEHFNKTRPLGPDVSIDNLQQNDTSNLDFTISSTIAEYLELAELNPQSEAFGRKALRTGKLAIYEYSTWIYTRLIERKQKSYGQTAARTILLLYSTHWQFLPTKNVIDCVSSLCFYKGASFAAIFFMFTNGSDLVVTNRIHPYKGPIPDLPQTFRGLIGANLKPGAAQWTVDMSTLD